MAAARLCLSVTSTPERMKKGVDAAVSSALASASRAGYVLGATMTLMLHVPRGEQGRAPFERYPVEEEVPEWLRPFVVRHERDLGPIMKVHGAVVHPAVSKDDAILAFDDDQAYPLCWVSELMACGAAVSCGSALDMALRPVPPGGNGATVAEGWAGVLVRKRVLDTPQWHALVEACSADPDAYLADDVVMSLYFQSVGADIGVAGEADAGCATARQDASAASPAANVRDRPLNRRTLAAGNLELGKQDDALSRTGKAHAARYAKVAKRIRAGKLGALVVPDPPPPPPPPPRPLRAPARVPLVILAGQSNMAGRGGVHRKQPGGEKVWDGALPDELISSPMPFGAAAFAALDVPDDWVHASAGPSASSPPLVWQPAREPLHAHLEPPGKVAGVGPGVLLARRLARASPAGCVGVVPCAVGETASSLWRRGGSMFDAMVARVRAAQACLPEGATELAACVFYQGESDCDTEARAAAWPGQVRAIASDVRAAFGAPGLPFVAVVPAPAPDGPNGRALCAHIAALRDAAALAQASSAADGVAWVDAAGFALASDGVHLTTSAHVAFAARLSAAVASRVGWPAPS